MAKVLSAPFTTSTAAVFSTPDRNDFTITDFYTIAADERAVSHLDDNIVIVNIDNSDRAEIAEILYMISLCGPKAVGLDVTFEDEREGDSILLDALSLFPHIIQPLTLQMSEDSDSFRVEGCAYFFNPQNSKGFAGSGLPSKYQNSIVREMKLTFPTEGLGDVPSFSAALALAVDSAAYAEILSRRNNLEIINYHSRRFRVYEPWELVDNAEELTGRIVMIGAMSERGDLHPTPVDPIMPGVMIHSHSLATILDRAYLNSIPSWAEQALAFLLCYFLVLFCINCNCKGRTLFLRIIQIGFVAIIVIGGYCLFINKNLAIDVTSTLLMLAFGLFANDCWKGVEEFIVKDKSKSDNKNKKQIKQ